jgi:hypothetical protein
MAARAEAPYTFAALLVIPMERLASSWKSRVGTPIFKISARISREKRQERTLKVNALLF